MFNRDTVSRIYPNARAQFAHLAQESALELIVGYAGLELEI